MKWKWDQYLGGGHTTKKMAALMKGILSKLPSEYFGDEHLRRRVDDVEGRDPSAARDRL